MKTTRFDVKPISSRERKHRLDYNSNLLRLAPTWFRIGSLEILAYQGELDILEQLTDFIIKQHFPDISIDDDGRYFEFYSQVVNLTALMIAQWQSVGFAHGVCNTDNFSLLGITIVYGPFGFMEEYDPGMVPNTSDDEAMLSYERQPAVGEFNLDKLRQALLPLIPDPHQPYLSTILAGYMDLYKYHHNEILKRKLGFSGKYSLNEQLLDDLLRIMSDVRSDFTMTFRQLGDWTLQDIQLCTVPRDMWALHEASSHNAFRQWCELYNKELDLASVVEDVERRQTIHSVSPRYILRNWMAQEAITAAEVGDDRGIRKLQRVLKDPYTRQEEAEAAGFANPPPEWAKRIRVSCSS